MNRMIRCQEMSGTEERGRRPGSMDDDEGKKERWTDRGGTGRPKRMYSEEGGWGLGGSWVSTSSRTGFTGCPETSLPIKK